MGFPVPYCCVMLEKQNPLSARCDLAHLNRWLLRRNARPSIMTIRSRLLRLRRTRLLPLCGIVLTACRVQVTRSRRARLTKVQTERLVTLWARLGTMLSMKRPTLRTICPLLTCCMCPTCATRSFVLVRTRLSNVFLSGTRLNLIILASMLPFSCGQALRKSMTLFNRNLTGPADSMKAFPLRIPRVKLCLRNRLTVPCMAL